MLVLTDLSPRVVLEETKRALTGKANLLGLRQAAVLTRNKDMMTDEVAVVEGGQETSRASLKHNEVCRRWNLAKPNWV